jgi:putative endonuclease
MTRSYWVYILASKIGGTLYVGVTNDLVRRTFEHREGLAESFTRKYKVHRLVYFEQHSDIEAAIQREKRIKKWNRDWKIRLIEETNPNWMITGQLSEDLDPHMALSCPRKRSSSRHRVSRLPSSTPSRPAFTGASACADDDSASAKPSSRAASLHCHARESGHLALAALSACRHAHRDGLRLLDRPLARTMPCLVCRASYHSAVMPAKAGIQYIPT